MCRLFGISYGSQQERVPTQVIAASLFANLTRKGPHAYGWFTTDGENVWTQKHFGRADTSEATETVLAEAVPEDMDESKMLSFVGHTRWATTGDPANMKNNHPISHGNLVGVHNGKVYNFEDILSVTGREDDESEVDSEAIFAAVNKWGPVKGLRRVNTDMVAVWTDLRGLDSIHIARSDNRPVSIGWTDRGNLIFASEEQALEALWPLVRFTKISRVLTYRLLKIRGGDIVSRRTYMQSPAPKPKVGSLVVPGARKAPAPAPRVLSEWTGSSDALDRLLELRDEEAKRREDRHDPRARQVERARARGAMAFD